MKTYLGFATKSGSLKFGFDNITKKAKLVLVSTNLSDGSLGKIESKCNINNIKLKTLESELFNSFCNKGVKVISIENYNLANAIYQLMEEN